MRAPSTPVKDRYRGLCANPDCGAPIQFVRDTVAPEGRWVHVAGGELCFADEYDVAEPADRNWRGPRRR